MQARILFALLALMLVFQLGAARYFRVHDWKNPLAPSANGKRENTPIHGDCRYVPTMRNRL